MAVQSPNAGTEKFRSFIITYPVVFRIVQDGQQCMDLKQRSRQTHRPVQCQIDIVLIAPARIFGIEGNGFNIDIPAKGFKRPPHNSDTAPRRHGSQGYRYRNGSADQFRTRLQRPVITARKTCPRAMPSRTTRHAACH